MFDNDFLKNLPEDSFEAGKIICTQFYQIHNKFADDKIRISKFEQYLKALAFAHAFAESYNVNLKIPTLKYEEGNSLNNLRFVVNFFSGWRNQVGTELKKEKNT